MIKFVKEINWLTLSVWISC